MTLLATAVLMMLVDGDLDPDEDAVVAIVYNEIDRGLDEDNVEGMRAILEGALLHSASLLDPEDQALAEGLGVRELLPFLQDPRPTHEAAVACAYDGCG